MINVERTFKVGKPVEVVVNYLKDFAHAEQWDPGTKSCVQQSPGPVQVGTTWHNVSVIRGKETELTYRLAELSADHILLVGENKTATSRDDMTVSCVDEDDRPVVGVSTNVSIDRGWCRRGRGRPPGPRRRDG